MLRTERSYTSRRLCAYQAIPNFYHFCNRAFSGLRTRHDGIFVGDGERMMTATYNSWGTCNVAIVSSDTSVLTVNREDATAKIYQIISTCDGKWGSIAMSGGVKGRNGRAIFTLSAKLK
ncbi:hypothetical protein PSHT_02389 [Puccinia striiformis]|uniref:Uncharacterized protein n=1 Tax=Puccinia striiformis TaxID=27350 RepID=A0A2S4WIE8_9BASI|nr:hypothetical protein PSHT_02389 [Puccinia striiformis]